MSIQKCAGVSAMLFLATVTQAWAQQAGGLERPTEWNVSFVNGYFTGGTWSTTQLAGERVKVETDGGWLVGLRFGSEEEYLGWEAMAAGVFMNMDLKADEALFDLQPSLRSDDDASLFLAALNLLWYPAGNDMGDGRMRPFLTVGPGLAHFTSDFEEVDGETMFDWNVGGGIKFLLGDEGNPALRFDYRFYQMFGQGELNSNIYRQEISVGIGIRF